MKIAFVGKGGSGKTTISTLFALHAAKSKPVTLIDADINVHIPDLLSMGSNHPTSISSDESAGEIKNTLIADNRLVKDPAELKKTTPPSSGSYIVDFDDISSTKISGFFVPVNDSLGIGVVGTYEGDKIGVSCYHNNLSVLENILSHSTANNSYVVVDMVAGTDAFASTMHAQFDASIVVVEPTQKSINVYKKYVELAKEAGTLEQIFYVANKIEDEIDREFIDTHLDPNRCLGYFTRSTHLRHVDKKQAEIDPGKLEDSEIAVLETIMQTLDECYIKEQDRLPSLWKLHEKYVAQGYVVARHGDLTSQIDTEFIYP
ncbi:MAG: hypothetical protein AAF413_04245 [Patescibacteria group bacterium]